MQNTNLSIKCRIWQLNKKQSRPGRKCERIVVSIEIELPTALENAQLPAFSSLLQLISKRNDYITAFLGQAGLISN